ncbi:MAG: amidohydrolase family protein [Nitrospina sp.]|nr:amidohydrolase family protein [Nitrospina sp.]
MYSKLGGDIKGPPEALQGQLTSFAKNLIAKSYADIDPSRLIDFHTHILGLGNSNSGIWVNPAMQNPANPMRYFRFRVFKNASGIYQDEKADRQYIARLLELIENLPEKGRFMILGFDKHYSKNGKEDLERTEFYIPNKYISSLVKKYPKIFTPMISIHPYRKDSLQKLEEWNKKGARFIKWLPNAMGIDPSDPRLDPYYSKVKELNMVILVHVGGEGAVHTGEFEKLGNPLLLRRPLDQGVKIVMAHCASRGTNLDLDTPSNGEVHNFDLFMRMMEEKRYEGFLFGEISGLTQNNRFDGPLQTLLAKKEWHSRLVNGSDYPLPALNAVIQTTTLVNAGLITEEERQALNLVYGYNPLLFDFVLKRTVRHPESGEKFPPFVFMMPQVLTN